MSDADQRLVQRMTDDIVGAQARHRRRTRWAIGAGIVVALAVAAPLAVVLNRPAAGGHPAAAPNLDASTSGAHHPMAPASGRSPSPQAEVYAAALRSWHGATAWNVYRSVCDIGGTCSAGRPTQALRDDLTALLGPALRFTDTAEYSISLQRVSVTGDHALAQLQQGCGPRCFEGQRAHYRRTPSGWREFGTTAGWIT